MRTRYFLTKYASCNLTVPLRSTKDLLPSLIGAIIISYSRMANLMVSESYLMILAAKCWPVFLCVHFLTIANLPLDNEKKRLILLIMHAHALVFSTGVYASAENLNQLENFPGVTFFRMLKSMYSLKKDCEFHYYYYYNIYKFTGFFYETSTNRS